MRFSSSVCLVSVLLAALFLPDLGEAEIRISSQAKKSRPPARAVTPKPKPRVYTPSTHRYRSSRSYFPWKRDITATIFWIGERPTAKNPTPNSASSWDMRWKESYGGYDDPNPANRTTGYRPKSFIPMQNPFYVALPYNDIQKGGTKPEAKRVVPWFKQRFKKNGHTTLKGQWLVVRYKDRFCFAQWEDCGPWVTDDWPYVFGKARPKNQANNGAGIDLSPAVRDYLRMKSGAKVDWRFVSPSEVRAGPWKYYGTNNRFAKVRVAPKPTLEELYEQRAKATRKKG